MTYRANPFAQKLDRLAAFTGVPALQHYAEKNVALPFRFAPLLPLAMAVVGLFVQIRVPEAGWLTVIGAWTAATPMMLTGPMRIPAGRPYDERERALVLFGRSAGLGAVALFAVSGCFLFSMLSAMAMFRLGSVWLPTVPTDWIALSFFMIVLYSTVAVLAVSWKIPRVPMADEED